MAIVLAMYAAAGAGVVFEQFQIYTLAFVVLCMAWLVFSGRTIEVFPLAIIFNDDLGSVPGGISAYMLFMALYVFDKVLRTPKEHFVKIQPYTIQKIPYYAIAVVFHLQMLMSQSISLKRLAIGIFSLVWAIDIFIEVRNSNKMHVLLKRMVLTIAYASLISAVSGYSSIERGAFGEYIERAGLLGHGSGGDPNIAGLTIVSGLIMLLMINMNSMVKLGIGAVLMLSVFRTVSLTTAAICACALFLFFLIKALYLKNIQVIKLIFGLIGMCVVIIVLYSNIEVLGVQSITNLKNRIDEAIMQIKIGDWSDVSTGRSDLAQSAIAYFQNQSIVRQLFGGNSLYVLVKIPHNTYLQHLLQFGIIGTSLLFIVGIYKLRCWIVRPPINDVNIRSGVITLKICIALFIATISVTSGFSLCLWLVVLLCL